MACGGWYLERGAGQGQWESMQPCARALFTNCQLPDAHRLARPCAASVLLPLGGRAHAVPPNTPCLPLPSSPCSEISYRPLCPAPPKTPPPHMPSTTPQPHCNCSALHIEPPLTSTPTHTDLPQSPSSQPHHHNYTVPHTDPPKRKHPSETQSPMPCPSRTHRPCWEVTASARLSWQYCLGWSWGRKSLRFSPSGAAQSARQRRSRACLSRVPSGPTCLEGPSHAPPPLYSIPPGQDWVSFYTSLRWLGSREAGGAPQVVGSIECWDPFWNCTGVWPGGGEEPLVGGLRGASGGRGQGVERSPWVAGEQAKRSKRWAG
ncbi:forkhead box protein L2-like [Chelonia mydas]|uniref:forkhead box protein L2-like n=1 Tax=Chelonia mydas TaxID=8469 RepID=UPI001CA87CE0|nr:forkhead box protein L2-like [Chelonia mydas]